MTHDFITIDAKITALLRDRNGSPLANADIAKHLGMDPVQCIKVVKRLERAGIVRPDRSRTQTKYFVPTAEQAAALEATVAAAEKALADVRVFREYKVPQPMKDIMARIKTERDAIPSFYGEMVNG